MKEAKVSGVVVNVASMGGLIPMGYSPCSAASKAGAIHYTRSIAEKMASYNKRASTDNQGAGASRINALCPSFIETPLLASLRDSNTTAKGAIESLGRVMTAGEAADSFM
eukprot:CFRG4408T1